MAPCQWENIIHQPRDTHNRQIHEIICCLPVGDVSLFFLRFISRHRVYFDVSFLGKFIAVFLSWSPARATSSIRRTNKRFVLVPQRTNQLSPYFPPSQSEHILYLPFVSPVSSIKNLPTLL